MLQIFSLIIIAMLTIYIFILQNKLKTMEHKLSNIMAGNLEFSNVDKEILNMHHQGRSNVEMIKFVRKETNLDLLQAKLYVDRILQQQ